MSSILKRVPVVSMLALVSFLLPQQASSQSLPWQKGEQQHHGNNANSPAPQSPSTPQNNNQELDDRRLNELATQFYNIKVKDKGAITKLRKLLGDVKNFSASLDQRSNSAHDVVNDTKNLEHRIAKQLKSWEARAAHSSTLEATSPTATASH